MKPNPWEWVEDDLMGLIALQTKESVELEYKQCAALQSTDSCKREISKDISAFANSAGGVIVYGIKENGHVPTAIDSGFSPSEISKEWLEQVINSNIQRRIEGIRINQVNLAKTSPGKVAYVVSIPQSARAPHQAADKRFYKRFNFESVPMEEYEIRDVGNRPSAPDLFASFMFHPGDKTKKLVLREDGAFFRTVGLTALVHNDADNPAEHAAFHFFIDSRIKLGKLSDDVNVRDDVAQIQVDEVNCTMTKLIVLWDNKRGLPLFRGITAELPLVPIPITIPVGPKWFLFQYIVGAPRMPTRQSLTMLYVKDNLATFKTIESN